MANIIINEISQNYSFNLGNNSYATVALPITACWGPCYQNPNSTGISKDEMLESVIWQRFPATQAGLESFVSTYRGPESVYRLTNDHSYHMAMTLICSGYDVLTLRVCPGTKAVSVITFDNGSQMFITAKYPGTFGNNLVAVTRKVTNRDYWNTIIYIEDTTGVRTAVDNIIYVLDPAKSTDSIPYIDEIESDFVTFKPTPDTAQAKEINEDSKSVHLSLGTDKMHDVPDANAIEYIKKYVKERYGHYYDNADDLQMFQYGEAVESYTTESEQTLEAQLKLHNEWKYNAAYEVYGLLTDKLSYNPNRIICPWDDQYIPDYSDKPIENLTEISPLHLRLMEVAYNSRCATAYIDVPKCLPRSKVYDETTTNAEQDLGYAQRLARYNPKNAEYDINIPLYSSHSALFAPWGQYIYAGTSKQAEASPSFLALLIQRAMILNQSIQYEWALPTNRRHDLKIGKLQYNVPKKFLDLWQSLDGVGVNAIAKIPELGTTLWGNSTLFEVPPATYQALANLSTRLLVNAVEDQVYRCGIAITFKYNNSEAYDAFFAGVTPLLDTMRNVGAIDDYKVTMSADIDTLGRVNANTVIGKIYLVVNGVVNDIIVDLIALPPGSDLTQFE